MLTKETTEMREIVDKIGKLTNPEEVLAIARMANNYYKNISREEGDSTDWKVGMMVQLKPMYQHRNPYDAKGFIIKVNKVKVRVKIGFVNWNIPKSILQVAEEE